MLSTHLPVPICQMRAMNEDHGFRFNAKTRRRNSYTSKPEVTVTQSGPRIAAMDTKAPETGHNVSFGRVFALWLRMRPGIATVRFLFVLALVFHCAGCKEQLARFRQSRASGEATASVKPGKGEQVCFDCAGKGQLKCGAGGCQNGQTECPAPCLKMSRGKWEPLKVAGHAADELWQKFPRASGGYDAGDAQHAGGV